MICPKCGFEQPESLECMRCGIVVSRYKGPVLGGAPAVSGFGGPPSLPPPLPAPPVRDSVPEPVAGGGTLYEGPMPGAAGAGGGTMYGGTINGGPINGATIYGGTVFGGQVSAPVPGRVQGRFEVGKVLSETFSIYFSNIIAFVLLTAISLSPVYLLQAYAVASGDPQLALVLQGVATLLSVLCQQVATAAITFGVFQQMCGRDASIADCLGRGFGSMGPVLLLAIVQGLGIWLGFLLCVVPGILLALRWAVSVPAAVEEKPGLSGALERSAYLTEGYRGEIFGIYFVLGILIIGAVLGVLVATKDQPTLQIVLQGIVNLFVTGLTATAASVMYYRLRSVKESIDVDQISSVFA